MSKKRVTSSDIFFLEDNGISEKDNSFWEQYSTSIKKEFDSKPIYNKTILKTKIKSYSDESTDFHDKEMPKAGSNYAWLALILIDFFSETDKNYYPQVSLKE